MSQLHRKRQTAYNSLFVSNADYRFLSRILLIDKCVRRSSLVKNAKRYNRFGHEHYLDRGDFNNVGSASGIQRAKSVYFRQTNWIPFTELSAQDITTSPIERNRKERSVFLKKGTARLRCTEGTFRVHNIYGDGNCMFRAISYILWRNEDEHRYLRSMVCFIFFSNTIRYSSSLL